jgi:RNA polymerase sigma factor (sigma-70 family)
MADRPTGLLGRLHRLAPADLAGEPDAALLDRFAVDPSDAPFAELVRRHGPMVLGVCRRVLGHTADAEDAFQAAFLVLARRAGAARGRPVGGWLCVVAGNVARRHRDHNRRRAWHERRAGAARPLAAPPPAPADELAAVLDDELGRLPARERAAVVACLLEGRTQEDAARQLGWSFSTLRRRLDRGKELLRGRLTGRGVTLPAGLAGLVVTESVPPALADMTRVGALGFARGVKTAAPAVTLAEGALTMMARTQLAVTTGVAVVVAGLAVGTGWALQPGLGGAPGGLPGAPGVQLPGPGVPGALPGAQPPAVPGGGGYPGGLPGGGGAPGAPGFPGSGRVFPGDPGALPGAPGLGGFGGSGGKGGAAPATDGRIRPGDRLQIEVENAFEGSPIRGAYLVEPGGTVALGAAYGRVDVAGKTFREAEVAAYTHLKQTLRDPRVMVTAFDPLRNTSLEERVRRLEQEVAQLKVAAAAARPGTPAPGGAPRQ